MSKLVAKLLEHQEHVRAGEEALAQAAVAAAAQDMAAHVAIQTLTNTIRTALAEGKLADALAMELQKATAAAEGIDPKPAQHDIFANAAAGVMLNYAREIKAALIAKAAGTRIEAARVEGALGVAKEFLETLKELVADEATARIVASVPGNINEALQAATLEPAPIDSWEDGILDDPVDERTDEATPS